MARAAEGALTEQKFVTPIDILTGIGWLAGSAVDRWRQGRVDFLEREVQANLSKVSTAMAIFRRWAERHGLVPSQTTYVARTRDRRILRFSKSGEPAIERAYRTHWFSPELSEAKRRRLAERQGRAPDLVVIQALREWTCATCSGTGNLLLMEDAGPSCMRCAGLDHLVFLPAGDPALTRRAKAGSRLFAVVVRISRSRGRYERQGLLVEEESLERAEEGSLTDEASHGRRRSSDAGGRKFR